MKEDTLLKKDGVLWLLPNIEPICPKHRLKMYPVSNDYSTHILLCEECAEGYQLPRLIYKEKQYIQDKLESKSFRNMKILNIDDEAVPVAEAKASSKDNKFFVTAVLTESRVGKRLIVYAGEKGREQKTQIFVEPDIKRLSFDQNNLHPNDVFVKIEGVFDDGSTFQMDKNKSSKKNK